MDNWKHTAPPKYNHPFNKRLSDTDYGLSSNKFLFLTFRKIGYYCPLKNPCLAHLPLLTQCQFPYYLFQGFPGGSAVENLPAHVGNTSSIPGLGRSPWRRKWQPTPVLLPRTHMDRGVWQAPVHGVTKGWTQLND